MSPPADENRPVTVVYAFLDFNEGGAQRLALDTWRTLDRARFRPVLLCVRRPGALADAAAQAGVPVHALGRLQRPFDLGAVAAIARFLREQRATIVHVPLYSRVSPYARLAARLAGVPLVVAHEHCRARPPTPMRRLADRLLLADTRFVAVSEADRAWLVSSGVPAGRIVVVLNGVDTERFRPGDWAGARAALDLPSTAPIVLVPARLEARKGHANLLAALPAILAQVPAVTVLCAGGGPLARVLPALAEAAGLAASVRFLGHRDDMPTLLAASDLVVLPSRMEGLPLAVLEALASARAVVATDAGGVAEVIADGVTGRLVPPANPASLAAAVVTLLADPDARENLATRGRALVLARFRVEDATRRLVTTYEGWLSERGWAVPPGTVAPLAVL